MPCRTALVLLLAMLALACRQAQPDASPNVSRARAEKVALAAAGGGTVLDGELERRGGRTVWSFDIGMVGTRDRAEIEVDAVTEKIVSDQRRSAPVLDEDPQQGHEKR